jgi:hypothetical protein
MGFANQWHEIRHIKDAFKMCDQKDISIFQFDDSCTEEEKRKYFKEAFELMFK